MDRVFVSSGSPYEETIGFSRAVRVGPYVNIGGTAPLGPDGSTVGVGDIALQARRCYEIIGGALEQAGAAFSDVVRTRTMLMSIDDWRTVSSVRAEFLGDVRPVDTIVEVSRFVDPAWLVEIEVDAVISVPA